jgi:hypothetical protein
VVNRYIAERNIANFKAAIAQETDPARRSVLEKLLIEERARLAEAKAIAAAEAAQRPKAG